jgi:hypothetical protein
MPGAGGKNGCFRGNSREVFKVSEKAKEMAKAFFAQRGEASPIRIMPYAGG